MYLLPCVPIGTSGQGTSVVHKYIRRYQIRPRSSCRSPLPNLACEDYLLCRHLIHSSLGLVCFCLDIHTLIPRFD